MMMKKQLLTAAMVLALSMATACGAQDVSENQAPVATMEQKADSDVSGNTVMEAVPLQEAASEEAAMEEAGTEAVSAGEAEAVDGTAVQPTETAEATSVTGVVDEIKDFMFVITDGAGTSYAFPYEEESELDLTAIEVGDKVTVSFVGTISEVDPFEGEILSIQKVEE